MVSLGQKVKIGQEGVLHVEQLEKSISFKVSGIGNSTSDLAGSIPVEIELEKSEGLIHGILAEAQLNLDSKLKYLIPENALFYVGKDAVLAKVKEGKVTKEKVKLGNKTANGIEILKGLNDGETYTVRWSGYLIDTYFNIREGRLKLRQGNVENSLIYYQRSNQAGPKEFYVKLARLNETEDLLEVLKASNGVKIVVDKKGEIFFINNVKFHLDNVLLLGYFVEIEAIDDTGSLDKEKLLEQCEHFLEQFDIDQKDLLESSYSDMIMELNNERN